MAPPPFKVHAYKVSPLNKKSEKIEKLLEEISKAGIEDRIRVIGLGHEIRVEHVQKHENGYYLLDLGRLRYDHGPGRASRDKEIEGFDFSNGEGFGEETAALYHPKSKHFLLQYNHYGVRAGSLAEYLGCINNNPDSEYTLFPRFDDSVEKKLKKKSVIRRLSFRVAVESITQADKALNMSLLSTLRAGSTFNAETVEIVLRASQLKHHPGLKKHMVENALEWLHKRLGISEDSVHSMKISGKDDPDAKTETLNLLGQRLEQKFMDLETDNGLRYPRALRWNALERALNGWDTILKG